MDKAGIEGTEEECLGFSAYYFAYLNAESDMTKNEQSVDRMYDAIDADGNEKFGDAGWDSAAQFIQKGKEATSQFTLAHLLGFKTS